MARLVVEPDIGMMHLHCAYNERAIAKSIGGGWNPSLKCWDLQFSIENVERVAKKFDVLELPPDFEDLLAEKQVYDQRVIQSILDAEQNEDVFLKVPGMKLSLYNYQKHGVLVGYYVQGGLLIADQMGLGKTAQALGIALYKKEKGAQRCLIVCPASLKYNWLEEIEKFTGEEAVIIEGAVEDRFQLWVADEPFFRIVNYAIFVRDLFSEKTMIPGAGDVLKRGFDIVLVDEIHAIKTHRAQRTRALKKMRTKFRVGLTGTPLDGRLEEMHSIFGFLQPGLFPSKKKFLDRYAEFDFWGGVEGYKRVDEFKAKIRPFYVRRLKKNVFRDMPPKVYQDVWVEFDSAAKKEYDKLAKRKHKITENKEAIVAVVRCRQFCDFPEILGINCTPSKYETLEGILEQTAGLGSKVLIFSQYTETTNRLLSRLEVKYRVQYLHGGTPPKERQALCHTFNDDPDVQIMIMTDAGSLGLNLQAASYVIHFDDNYSPAVMYQREDRAHRLGVKHCVNVIRFVCHDTIEERVRIVLSKKETVTKSVLDEDVDEYSIGSLSPRELLLAL